jgi:hypothetical protein
VTHRLRIVLLSKLLEVGLATPIYVFVLRNEPCKFTGSFLLRRLKVLLARHVHVVVHLWALLLLNSSVDYHIYFLLARWVVVLQELRIVYTFKNAVDHHKLAVEVCVGLPSYLL